MSASDLLTFGPAAIALAAWLAAVARVVVATRTAALQPAPATQDLGGEQSPAVVALLANGWRVTEDAAEATLLDLAARGAFELRQGSDDPRTTTLHLPADPPAVGWAEHEQLVLDRVREVAAGGVAPLTALSFRDDARAETFAGTFATRVVALARSQGLSRPRYSARTRTVLGAAGLVPIGVVALTCALAFPHAKDPLRNALAGGVAAAMLVAWVLSRVTGERDTPQGREVAQRWLGLRGYLDVDEAFQALPPSAVQVWGRYLGFGAALGQARVCSAVIDLGLGDRENVWSRYGGTWHRVRVRYPRAGVTYGASLPALLLVNVMVLAVAAMLLWALGVHDSLARLGEDRYGQVLAIPAGVAALVLVAAGYRLVRAVLDAASPRTVTGEVLWIAVAKQTVRDGEVTVHLLHLAVDDGSTTPQGARTTAWALPPSVDCPCPTGSVAEVTVRRWTRRVLRVRPASSPGGS